ncbi:outer envelope protein 61 [Silene latifolia]|uniref:outer envelope protein 61 n=1 Tax=Silene latifolia TaxID=37657 RepID=UPI003D786AB1
MFNGMMDPELFKLAQEQMSRMSPDELAKIQQQMMSNPDLLNMATESMKNMRPEDLKYAAEQMKNVRPEDMADIGEKMANASPDEIAAMRARADAQMAYELNAAEMLKKQGNQLHSQGKYQDAAQKYSLAKKNVKGVPVAKGRTLQLACSLNLMSCYLKTGQFHDCIAEGSEVLAYDGKNVKALYRRGQAYRELGQLQEAVSDLMKAHENSPDDNTITEVLSAVKENLGESGITRSPTGLVIEEITEETETASSGTKTSRDFLVTHPDESRSNSEFRRETVSKRPTTESECLEALKDDPDTIRSFQNFMSNADPEMLAKMGAGKTGEVPVDMLKSATNMIGRMSPDELQNMIKMASSLQGDKPPFSNSPFESNFGSGSVPPNLSPEMLKTASDMMSKMPPDELQRMFEMASSLKQSGSVPSSSSARVNTSSKSKLPESQGAPVDRNNIMSERSSTSSSFADVGSTSQPSFPASMDDMQEQMRNQMKDPAMRQMFSSMMKNMSPDMMANMSEQFGLKLSKEDAAKAQEAMASLSPEDLDKMMRWADRIQKGVEGAKKTKNWLLGRPGMILAIFMLILAAILHRFGFIGR